MFLRSLKWTPIQIEKRDSLSSTTLQSNHLKLSSCCPLAGGKAPRTFAKLGHCVAHSSWKTNEFYSIKDKGSTLIFLGELSPRQVVPVLRFMLFLKLWIQVNFSYIIKIMMSYQQTQSTVRIAVRSNLSFFETYISFQIFISARILQFLQKPLMDKLQKSPDIRKTLIYHLHRLGWT